MKDFKPYYVVIFTSLKKATTTDMPKWVRKWQTWRKPNQVIWEWIRYEMK